MLTNFNLNKNLEEKYITKSKKIKLMKKNNSERILTALHKGQPYTGINNKWYFIYDLVHQRKMVRIDLEEIYYIYIYIFLF